MRIKLDKNGKLKLSKLKKFVNVKVVKFYKLTPLSSPEIGFKIKFYDKKRKLVPLKPIT